MTSEWHKAKLDDVLTVKRGETITKKEAQEGPFPVILGGKEPAYYIDKYNHTGKAIVISRSGASAGYVSFWNQPIFVTDGFLLEPKEGISYEFLYQLLKNKQFELHHSQRGAAIPHVTPALIKAINIVLPPDDIRERIASILTAYELLIENNNRRIFLLEHMAETLYKEWFVRFRFSGYEKAEFENGLPKGWKSFKAEEHYKISIGKTPPRKDFEWFTKGNPTAQNWLSISDMAGTFVSDTDEQITQAAVSRFNMMVAPRNSILLSFKLTVGRVAIAAIPLCTNEAIAHFKEVPEIEREFLYLQLKLYEYSSLGNTSAIGNAINSKIVKAMRLILPSEEVLTCFHRVVKPMFDSMESLKKRNEILSRQRDLLLPRLMSGKLIV